jgi:hypothetical protein
MARYALVDPFIVSSRWRRHEGQPVRAQRFYCEEDVAAAASEDFAIWASQGTREQARVLTFDVEVPDLAEIEQALVETCPNVHAAPADIVRQVIEIIEAPPLRFGIALTEPKETVVINRALRASVPIGFSGVIAGVGASCGNGPM